MIPQIILIVFAIMSLTIHLVKHGENRGTYDFGLALVALAIEFVILYCGGFFNPLTK